MDVYNRGNSRNTGELPVLTSWMLISPRNSLARGLSLQVSEIPVGSAQPIHCHEPEQCYYIVKGEGLMTIGDETLEVAAGDAVFIPSNSSHGIRNLGDGILEYITANSPVFEGAYEDALWPGEPDRE